MPLRSVEACPRLAGAAFLRLLDVEAVVGGGPRAPQSPETNDAPLSPEHFCLRYFTNMVRGRPPPDDVPRPEISSIVCNIMHEMYQDRKKSRVRRGIRQISMSHVM